MPATHRAFRPALMADVVAASALFCAAYAPYIVGGAFFPAFSHDAAQGLSDTLPLTLPAFSFTGACLSNGVVPLWDPFMYCGFPHLAMGFTGVFYPSTGLYALLSFPVAFKIDVLFHLYLRLVCACWLGRAFFRNRVAVLAVALTSLADPVLNYTLYDGHIETVRVLARTPLAFLCLWKALDTG